MAAGTPLDSTKLAHDRRKPPLSHLDQLHQPAWYLWAPGLAITLLLALGTVAFLFPGLMWREYVFTPAILRILPQLSLGLLALVLLEAIYIIARVRESTELREFILAISEGVSFEEAELPRDSLTGALDRRALPEILRRESTWVDRYRIPLCLVLSDIRDFSKLNEREGNMAGDLVLKDFAQALQTTLRQTDTALRYGPDEFLCLLPRTDSAGGKAFTRRLKQACQALGRLRDLPVDFGLAVYEPGGDANAALASAEEDLASHKISAQRPDSSVATLDT